MNCFEKLSDLNLEFLLYLKDKSMQDFKTTVSEFRIPQDGLQCFQSMNRSDLREIANAGRPLFIVNIPPLVWNKILYWKSMRHLDKSNLDATHQEKNTRSLQTGSENFDLPFAPEKIQFINLEFLLSARENAKNNVNFTETALCVPEEILDIIVSIRRSDIYLIAKYAHLTFVLDAPSRVWNRILDRGALKVTLRRLEWRKPTIVVESLCSRSRFAGRCCITRT